MRRPHRRAHGRAWAVLVVLIPALLFGALTLRPAYEDAPRPERIGGAE